MQHSYILAIVLAALLLFAGCSQAPAETAAESPATVQPAEAPEEVSGAETAAPVETPALDTTAPAGSDEAADTESPSQATDLIVYFSWSGNTKQVADAIQHETGADVFEIVPVTAYPEDYDETIDVAQQEKRDAARPAFEGEIPNFDAYERVFVGFPNWWGDMPMILYTFFDTYDLSGKTLAPFVTSSSSGFSSTRATMQSLEPGAQMTDGLDIKERDLNQARSAVSTWLEQIKD